MKYYIGISTKETSGAWKFANHVQTTSLFKRNECVTLVWISNLASFEKLELKATDDIELAVLLSAAHINGVGYVNTLNAELVSLVHSITSALIKSQITVNPIALLTP